MSLKVEIAIATATLLAMTSAQVHNACAADEGTADQTGSRLIGDQERDERTAAR